MDTAAGEGRERAGRAAAAAAPGTGLIFHPWLPPSRRICRRPAKGRARGRRAARVPLRPRPAACTCRRGGPFRTASAPGPEAPTRTRGPGPKERRHRVEDPRAAQPGAAYEARAVPPAEEKTGCDGFFVFVFWGFFFFFFFWRRLRGHDWFRAPPSRPECGIWAGGGGLQGAKDGAGPGWSPGLVAQLLRGRHLPSRRGRRLP
jgi:hypothetical protein